LVGAQLKKRVKTTNTFLQLALLAMGFSIRILRLGLMELDHHQKVLLKILKSFYGFVKVVIQ
jgi:hypothetical protein